MSSASKIKKKNIPRSTNEMSKEMLIETLKKKKECNAKALSIVEKLSEGSLDENLFLAYLPFINQCHFEDVITERAILKICGYPLCQAILKNIPTKKYHISSRCNKVFDITERKNFCSNVCYKAAMFIKSQLLTSPLWFRENEVIPKFKLLPCSTSSMGEEIVFLPDKEQLKKDVLSMNSMGFDNTLNVNKTADELKSLNLESDDDKAKSSSATHMVNNIAEVPIRLETTDNSNDLVENCKVVSKTVGNGKYVNTTEKLETRVELDPVKKVEKFIYEWFTLDTMLYLYGEKNTSELMKNQAEEIKDIIRMKPLVRGNSEKIDRLLNFYSLLDRQLSNSDSTYKTLMPLPDYSMLKEDGKKLEIKVRAFYKGQLEVGDSSDLEKCESNSEEPNELYLPSIDAHNQNCLRIKILLNRFGRIIPDLIRTFTNEYCFEIGELRTFLSHCKLSAHNIMFKPSEWCFAGLIIVKMYVRNGENDLSALPLTQEITATINFSLSLKNKKLESLLKTEVAQRHITLLLMNYNLPQGYLENLMEWLTNPDDLIKKMKSSTQD